jgi:hypothetical protein
VITAETITQWAEYQYPVGPWAGFKKQYVLAQDNTTPAGKAALGTITQQSRAFPPKFQALVKADLEAMNAGKPVPAAPPRELLAALDEMEGRGLLRPLA